MQIENYLNQKYEFKFNTVTNRTYYKEKKSTSEFLLLKEFKINSIKREIENSNIRVTKSDLATLLHSDYVPQFDPFQDYFTKLGNWDQNTDYISQLANTITTTNQELFVWAFKKWIVAVVACAIERKTTNQSILILSGKQGLGKSTWLERLVPQQLQEYYYSGQIQPGNKDNALLLSDKLLINLDELASLTKKGMEAFKEMVTKNMITERRAYAHFTEDYIRRASFVGSSNHNEILMDVTGNRRFLCFEALEINYNHTVSIDDVFRQAHHLLGTQDFSCHFQAEDIKRLEENNKMFVQSSEEVEWIEDLFEVPDGKSDSVQMSATEIVQYIKSAKSIYQKIEVVQIGKIMTAKGFPKKKTKGCAKYIVTIKKG